MVVDAVLLQIMAGAIAILFLTAAFQKLQHHQQFRTVLATYELLPVRLVPLVAVLVPPLEMTTGVTLLFSATQPLGIGLAASLLLGYALAMAINLSRGREDIDCGCQLGAARQPLSVALVIRNLVLAAASGALMLPVHERLTTWFDYGIVAFGVLIACLVYGIGNNLIATHTFTAHLYKTVKHTEEPG